MCSKQRTGLLGLLKGALKTNLIAGLLVVIPLAATAFFLGVIFRWADKILLLIPEPFRPENYLPFNIPGLGIILLVMALFLIGFLARNILGRTLVRLGERIMNNIPLVNKFYQAVKQLVETIFIGGGKDFKRVVLIEYPRKGIYALAYVTGKTYPEFQNKTDKPVINLFLPTTPNPTSGFYLLVPEEDVITLDISVEDSFKILISGGIINPDEVKRSGGSE
ncbi:DUF502 domain-containing protein [Desulfovibrio ferrophilus]|uniref:Transporter n=1 Tax=Desulfovibrio ferrophilus TaxID=241368 RepID=A0A2Z6B2E7_9BACT|nr:DUF502 domain-containing protein [Desulfovibrio ferrophilus]BBD09618.1 uncharacterized protein DFE_2892 [Desulfovibrio ferrophilus]